MHQWRLSPAEAKLREALEGTPDKEAHKAVVETGRSQREAEFFNRIADEQAEAWWGHLTPAGRQRDLRRANVVLEGCGLRSGMKALEIGCGGGSFAANYNQCLPDGVQVVAIDIADRLIGRAKARSDIGPSSKVQFEVANVEHLSFDTATFDAVFGSSILHHLDLDKALPELVRVLKPGGRFCFAEPNMANPEVFLTRNVNYFRKASQTSEDETAFFRGQIGRILRGHGLADLEVRPFDFLHPRTPEHMISLVDRLGRMAEKTPVLREVSGSLLIRATKNSDVTS